MLPRSAPSGILAEVSVDRDPRHFVQEQRVFEPGDSEEFDRMEFALEVLRLLEIPRMTVALYPGKDRLSVSRGHDFARGPGATWAIVAVPPNASRMHIVYALAELAGVHDVPYVVDTLARRHANPYRTPAYA